MNINQAKAVISAQTGFQFPVLQLVRQFDQDSSGQPDETKPQPWLSHWDNENRIRVTVHEDILKSLKANPEFNGLAVRKDVVDAKGDRKAYTRFVLITPKHIEATF